MRYFGCNLFHDRLHVLPRAIGAYPDPHRHELGVEVAGREFVLATAVQIERGHMVFSNHLRGDEAAAYFRKNQREPPGRVDDRDRVDGVDMGVGGVFIFP